MVASGNGGHRNDGGGRRIVAMAVIAVVVVAMVVVAMWLVTMVHPNSKTVGFRSNYGRLPCPSMSGSTTNETGERLRGPAKNLDGKEWGNARVTPSLLGKPHSGWVTGTVLPVFYDI